MAECFAWLSSLSHLKPDVLIIGAVAGLGAAEAVRETVQARLGRRQRAISYAASAQSAPPLAGLSRLKEAEKAHTWLAVDGNFGPKTTSALQVFLTRKGMNTGKIDGVFGTKTKRALQEFLRGSGYDVGKIDGFFGPRSVMALQSWIKQTGYSPKGPSGNTIDGIFGPFTTRSLQQTLNTELAAPSPGGVKRTASSSSFSAEVKREPNSPSSITRHHSSSNSLRNMGFLQEGEKKEPRTTLLTPRRTLTESASPRTQSRRTLAERRTAGAA
jgi:hypothetical protein